MILLPAEEEETTLGARPDKVRPGDRERRLCRNSEGRGLSPHSGISVPSSSPWSGETQSWPQPLNSEYK